MATTAPSRRGGHGDRVLALHGDTTPRMSLRTSYSAPSRYAGNRYQNTLPSDLVLESHFTPHTGYWHVEIAESAEA